MTAQPIDIAGLRELEARATAGKWRAYLPTYAYWPGIESENETIVLWAEQTTPESNYEDDGGVRGEDVEKASVNAALIVAMRNAFPALLTELEQAREENARLRAGMEDALGFCGTVRQAIPRASKARDVLFNTLIGGTPT